MKTGNRYFVEVSKGTVEKVLGKVNNNGGGMGGFFDMFASSKTRQKVAFIASIDPLEEEYNKIHLEKNVSLGFFMVLHCI